MRNFFFNCQKESFIFAGLKVQINFNKRFPGMLDAKMQIMNYFKERKFFPYNFIIFNRSNPCYTT